MITILLVKDGNPVKLDECTKQQYAQLLKRHLLLLGGDCDIKIVDELPNIAIVAKIRELSQLTVLGFLDALNSDELKQFTPVPATELMNSEFTVLTWSNIKTKPSVFERTSGEYVTISLTDYAVAIDNNGRFMFNHAVYMLSQAVNGVEVTLSKRPFTQHSTMGF